MIDVHILHLPERAEWLKECLASLEGQPVNIHVLPAAAPAEFGKARATGYSLGDCEYVAQIGDDDTAIEGAFVEIEHAFEEHQEAAFVQTQWYTLYNGHRMLCGDVDAEDSIIKKGDTRFPLCEAIFAYRRKVLEDCFPVLSAFGKNADLAIQNHIKENYTGVYINKPLCLYRYHSKGLHTL